MTGASVPLHRWQRVSSRKGQCSACGLVAHAKHDPIRQRAYTRWEWRGLAWDSRSNATPTCPPSYGSATDQVR